MDKVKMPEARGKDLRIGDGSVVRDELKLFWERGVCRWTD